MPKIFIFTFLFFVMNLTANAENNKCIQVKNDQVCIVHYFNDDQIDSYKLRINNKFYDNVSLYEDVTLVNNQDGTFQVHSVFPIPKRAEIDANFSLKDGQPILLNFKTQYFIIRPEKEYFRKCMVDINLPFEKDLFYYSDHFLLPKCFKRTDNIFLAKAYLPNSPTQFRNTVDYNFAESMEGMRNQKINKQLFVVDDDSGELLVDRYVYTNEKAKNFHFYSNKAINFNAMMFNSDEIKIEVPKDSFANEDVKLKMTEHK